MFIWQWAYVALGGVLKWEKHELRKTWTEKNNKCARYWSLHFRIFLACMENHKLSKLLKIFYRFRITLFVSKYDSKWQGNIENCVRSMTMTHFTSLAWIQATISTGKKKVAQVRVSIKKLHVPFRFTLQILVMGENEWVSVCIYSEICISF